MTSNTLKTALFMTVLTVLFIAVGGVLGGRSGVIFAFGFALLMNFFSYWFSDKIVLKMYRAKEANEADAPDLYRIVRNLATKGNLPMPKVYIVNNPAPNAFATGRNPEHGVVAVTTGIMQILNEDELEGVLAHELSHIYGRDILIGTIAATFAGAIMMLADWARFAAIFGGFSRDNDEGGSPGGIVVLIVVSILAPIAAMIVQMTISRSREYLADERGAHLSHKPRALASALAKISGTADYIPMENANAATAHMMIINPLKGKSLLSLFATHPPVEERIKRLNALAEKIG
ncbi:peptidase M48 Ste24p [Denitrovibrio acetiphilus DSM 12809]|uniref:Protease HtpX homolog n=1 Tax=Denitrovibrio acetiphilus (strain DSM 12809 / NBRC 114555 / N2460) TaxID=522772 RepID=D4H5Q9_DENA2|nr:zinc metalloprotease HtpX [Denitrovibrio acetiphilus]ADD69500.1 peptidase M48 Ste24p [Denitrovibrio acetiphilus DSM 12809]